MRLMSAQDSAKATIHGRVKTNSSHLKSDSMAKLVTAIPPIDTSPETAMIVVAPGRAARKVVLATWSVSRPMASIYPKYAEDAPEPGAQPGQKIPDLRHGRGYDVRGRMRLEVEARIGSARGQPHCGSTTSVPAQTPPSPAPDAAPRRCPAGQGSGLFHRSAMLLGMELARVGAVTGCMAHMAMSHLGVMPGQLRLAGFVLLGGFAMVLGR